jgi:NAD dependent epimerase/dehydratase family enzyme
MNVLICGHRSFAAKGLAGLLREDGHAVTCFSRGVLDKKETVVTGDVYEIGFNPYLAETFDVVINFIVIKDGTVEDNVRYVKTLAAFAEKCGAKRLIQISSISVYPNDAQSVNEYSPIEGDFAKKGAYARLKVASDLALKDARIAVTFVRPGFIVSDDKRPSLAGIVKPLPLIGGLLLGGRETPLPLIRRESLHHALRILVGRTVQASVCLAFANRCDTKGTFARTYFKRHVVAIPPRIVKMGVRVVRDMRLLSFSTACQIFGLFKTTHFDSTQTENVLGMRFE